MMEERAGYKALHSGMAQLLPCSMQPATEVFTLHASPRCLCPFSPILLLDFRLLLNMRITSSTKPLKERAKETATETALESTTDTTEIASRMSPPLRKPGPKTIAVIIVSLYLLVTLSVLQNLAVVYLILCGFSGGAFRAEVAMIMVAVRLLIHLDDANMKVLNLRYMHPVNNVGRLSGITSLCLPAKS